MPSVHEPTSMQESQIALADGVWDFARSGNKEGVLELLELATHASAELDPHVRASLELFEANRAKREDLRQEQIEEANTELDGHLAAYDAERSPDALSDALESVVRLQLLKEDNEALFADARIDRVLSDAERAARDAERRGDWLVASELFFRLETVFDQAGTYKEDVDRLGDRLTMIRMYAPERLWELRNERRLAEGLDGLPAYNPYGDDHVAKLQGVTSTAVRTAIQRAAQQHVGRETRENPDGVTMNQLLIGGLDAVRTMATTTDLARTFAGLGNATRRNAFIARVDERQADIRSWRKEANALDLRRAIDGLLSDAGETVGIMPEAILHEFGNGAMSELDTYSAFIWPDELARFRRSTDGEFTGVGIQIQLDETQNIKVVTPLEGTPAQRAGVRSDDIIKKINGISAVGLELNQAVEIITGPANTTVDITMERRNAETDEVEEITFTLTRQRIDLPSVTGWEKTGAGDEDWDWFLDREAGIGYIRLTGFTADSTRDFDRAVRSMKAEGLNGLVFDLRYNPGGLLDQAVSIASRFVPDGMIVRTVDANGVPQEQQNAKRVRDDRDLSELPVVVLLNEGSASASEIVAGSVQAAAKLGKNKSLVLGQRSFGKGSVQNVFLLPGGRSGMKLTTHFYRVNSPRTIHKMPGATEWGVDPDLEVDMLSTQQQAALLLRRDADVLPLDQDGN
ncbi:MAG: S41 family peptidase, partial [Planctomycetota bacterium]